MNKYRIADHKIIDTEHLYFIYLCQENAVFEMTPEIRSLVDRYHGDSEQLTEDLETFRKKPESGQWEIFQSLLSNRVILPMAPEEKTPQRPNFQKIPMQTMVLHITDACNLNCAYCYHGSRHYVNHGGMMSYENARRATDLLLKNSDPAKEVVLVFFGGEPLLHFPLIKEITAYSRQKFAAVGKKVNFAITTNATTLTSEKIDFLHENEIGVTVSIDGVGDVHDRYRRFKDGAATYTTVENNVQALLKGRKNRPVVARVTVAHSPGHVPEILDHLLSLGFSEAGFSPVTSDDPAYQLDDEAMALLLEKFQEMSDRFLQKAIKNDFLGFTNLIDLLTTFHEGEVKSHPCGAGLGLFSVDVDGGLYPCQRLTGRKQWLMGDVFDGPDIQKLTFFRNAAALETKKPCNSCWARALCAGGCYHEALVRMGDASAPNLHYCNWIKNWLMIGLRVYTKLYLVNPDYLDKLSLLRGRGPIPGAVV